MILVFLFLTYLSLNDSLKIHPCLYKWPNNPGIEPWSPALQADFLPFELQGSAYSFIG